MLEEARTMSDPGDRLALYRMIEETLATDAAAIFISHTLDAALVNPYVTGYELTPIGVPQWGNVALER